MPELEAVYQKHKEQGLLVIGISTSDEIANVEKVVKEKGITFPILIADATVESAFGGEGTPETFLIDRSGKVFERIVGAKDEAFFEERARTMLAGQ